MEIKKKGEKNVLTNSSVATGPGATQFAVIRVPLSSFTKTLTIASTAAFEAVYASYPGRFINTSD
ncbi:hypothetical protein KSP40_PGU006439 [Platanthera guangdongensis]|uniref:Uncharacterized protein n=1 Tax=Platanthera guangdongensis TaxID=2320717 RepID=A0ABR2MIR0_9ASPA